MGEQEPLQEPPLPRYRFQRSTGTWRREAARHGVEPAIAGPAVESKSYESSYDYFLRCSYAVEKKTDPDALRQRQSEDAWSHIERFQVRHLNCSDAPELLRGGREETSSSDGDGGRGASAGRCDSRVAPPISTQGTNDDDAATEKQRLRVRAAASPLMGFLAGVPLSEVYDALRRVKGSVLPSDVAAGAPEVRLTFEEFRIFLGHVREADAISGAYQSRMMRLLPSYDSSSKTCTPYDLYSYVVEHSHHPRLNLSVEMLFRAFDTDDKGIIPIEALHSRVVAAWAEVNTFGNLRDQWLKLSAALEADEDDGTPLGEGMTFVDKQLTRALLCTSPLLFSVADSINLEGGKKVAVLATAPE